MSDLEEALAWQLKACNLPEPEREVVLIPGRRWRVDFLFRSAALVVEVEGGIFRSGGGAHSSPTAIVRDIEKGNALMLAGYRLLRVTGDMVNDGRALALIERALVSQSVLESPAKP